MNAGKYRPEKTPHLDTFCSVQIILECTWRLKLWFIQCISVINVVVDLVRVKKIYLVCLSIYWTNKNGRLYQGFTDSYIYRPYGLWKKSSYFRLDRKRILTTSSLSLQRSHAKEHVILNIPKAGSDLMTIFALWNQKTSYING